MYSGGEGWRTWSPASRLSSGYWGLGVSTNSWGAWSVQRPDNFETGAQGRGNWGPWTLAAGADRTWPLDPQPLDSPWDDRARVGMTYQASGLSAGEETTVYVPALGPWGLGHRARLSGMLGPWSFQSKGGLRDSWVRPDLDSWTLSGQAGWGGWLAGWDGAERDASGRLEAGWESRGTGARLSWGPKKGWVVLGILALDYSGVSCSLLAGLGAGPSGWSSRQKVAATAPYGRGRWSASFQLESGQPEPSQTTTIHWKESNLEVEGRWQTEGFRLGWMGPKNTFNLTLRWLF
jgi:hypothetical protein